MDAGSEVSTRKSERLRQAASGTTVQAEGASWGQVLIGWHGPANLKILAGLKPEEAAVLAMLRSRLANEFARTPAAAKSTGSIGETAHAA
jgi:hypothetical protein